MCTSPVIYDLCAYINPELYHSNVLPLKSLLGAIISVILRASCGLRVAELTGNSTVLTTSHSHSIDLCFLVSRSCLLVFQSLCQQIKTQLKSSKSPIWKYFGFPTLPSRSKILGYSSYVSASAMRAEGIQHSWPHHNQKTGMSSASKCQHVGPPR